MASLGSVHIEPLRHEEIDTLSQTLPDCSAYVVPSSLICGLGLQCHNLSVTYSAPSKGTKRFIVGRNVVILCNKSRKNSRLLRRSAFTKHHFMRRTNKPGDVVDRKSVV